MERIPTGISALDELLQGGIPKGATVLISGSPGTGKTIMAHQMMFFNASPRFKTIYLTTLAEPQVKIMKFQQQFSFFDKSKFQSNVIYQDLGNTLFRHGTERVLAYIDELLKKYEPGLIVIDTIKTITDMFYSFTDFRKFLLDLSLRLATWGCTCILLGEYSEEEIEIRPESTIADGIIHLYGTEEKKRQKRYLRILKMRGTAYSGGENRFRISQSGIDVYPRLNPVVSGQSYHASRELLSSGILELDRMMNGGITRSTTTLVSGSSGTGKTLLALSFVCAGLKRGEPGVFVSFEENPAQIVKAAASIGIDLTCHISCGLLHLVHISPIELDIDEHVYIIQNLVRKTGARHLVLDSISSFEIGLTNKVAYTDYIWALTDYFKTQGVTVLLTHELQDSARTSVLTKHGISFMADNLLLLHPIERDGQIKLYLRVVKIRGSKHDRNPHELLINDNGLFLAEEN